MTLWPFLETLFTTKTGEGFFYPWDFWYNLLLLWAVLSSLSPSLASRIWAPGPLHCVNITRSHQSMQQWASVFCYGDCCSLAKQSPHERGTQKKADVWFKWYLDINLGHFGQHHCVFFPCSKCDRLVHRGWILSPPLLYGMFQVQSGVAHGFGSCIVTWRERLPQIFNLSGEGFRGDYSL